MRDYVSELRKYKTNQEAKMRQQRIVAYVFGIITASFLIALGTFYVKVMPTHWYQYTLH